MAVAIGAGGSTFEPGLPQVLFRARIHLNPQAGRSYAVAQKGDRFLVVVEEGAESAASITLLIAPPSGRE
jgi:hypothetical protein